MGRKSGITVGGYHPRIHHMQMVMAQREWNADMSEKSMKKKKMRANYWSQRLSNAMGTLYQADPNGWEAWFDNDKNVPAEANDREFALIVETRVRELVGYYPFFKCRTRRGIFIWQDALGVYVYSKEENKRNLYALDFNSFDEAETFLRGLPFKNIGCGVVLDLLPVQAMGR
jgi:hypothetical protein